MLLLLYDSVVMHSIIGLKYVALNSNTQRVTRRLLQSYWNV